MEDSLSRMTLGQEGSGQAGLKDAETDIEKRSRC
jgi:hypothetical protein